jgi:hypothetical protein
LTSRTCGAKICARVHGGRSCRESCESD